MPGAKNVTTCGENAALTGELSCPVSSTHRSRSEGSLVFVVDSQDVSVAIAHFGPLHFPVS